MHSVPRPVLRRAAVAALAALAIGTALGACTSTVEGRGTLEVAAGPRNGPIETTGPTSGPTSSPTDQPTSGPTDQPTSGPTDGPTEQPTDPAGDQQAVASAAEDFYHALGAKDGERACDLMTAAAQQEVAEGSDCVTSVSEISLTAEQASALSRIQIDPALVQVSGERAVVPARAASVDGQASSTSGEMIVLREGGDWKINDINS